MKHFQDNKWCLKAAVVDQVSKEDLLMWAKRPLNADLSKVNAKLIESPTWSKVALYTLFSGVRKEARSWLP